MTLIWILNGFSVSIWVFSFSVVNHKGTGLKILACHSIPFVTNNL